MKKVTKKCLQNPVITDKEIKAQGPNNEDKLKTRGPYSGLGSPTLLHRRHPHPHEEEGTQSQDERPSSSPLLALSPVLNSAVTPAKELRQTHPSQGSGEEE